MNYPKNYPNAYKENSMPFYGRDFYVDHRAYVSNHETHQLIDCVLEYIDENDSKSVIDVGTGAGSIGITLALERAGISVVGGEVDWNALQVAHINTEKHAIKSYTAVHSNYVNNPELEQPDVVVADLPYGDPDHNLPSSNLDHFAHMPGIALWHPDGILAAYEGLIQSILDRGWKTTLFFETGVISKDEVAKIIPKGLEWKYIKFEDYSISKAVFQ